MGTSGVYGFYFNGKEKVTYNHYGSEPRILGYKIIDAIRETPLEKLMEIALNIELVSLDSNPTIEQIAHCKPWTDLSVSKGNVDDWYCLLRKAQGDLSSYTKHGLKYMFDYSNFLLYSLACEWAYIINLDTMMLEVYSGFYENSNKKGRYSTKEILESGRCGVNLVLEIPLQSIIEATEKKKYDKFKQLVKCNKHYKY